MGIEIKAAQAVFGGPFPPDLVRFYATINGGSPQVCCFVYAGREYQLIHEFLFLAEAMRAYQAGVATALLPDDLFPFAMDEGGNTFCFAKGGNIVFTIHDIWDENLSARENQARSCRLVAQSYEQFVERLITQDEAEQA